MIRTSAPSVTSILCGNSHIWSHVGVHHELLIQLTTEAHKPHFEADRVFVAGRRTGTLAAAHARVASEAPQGEAGNIQ